TAGALLLLVSPASALDVLVPVLIVFALVMVVFQKQFTTALRRASEKRARRRPERARAGTERNPLRSPALVGSLGAASVYGGYFTAAQGVLYLGILGVFTGRSMGSVNSIKNLMSLGVNLAAAVVYVLAFFLFDAEIVWLGSLAIADGSLLRGFFRAHLVYMLRGLFTGRSMRSVNSIKALMSLGVNLAAAVVYVLAFFLFDAEIVWLGSLAIAVGSLLGGFFGAHLAKRLPEWVLRGIIVVVAL